MKPLAAALIALLCVQAHAGAVAGQKTHRRSSARRPATKPVATTGRKATPAAAPAVAEPEPAPASAPQTPPAPQPAVQTLRLVSGGSTVLTTEFPITRIAITNPGIAAGTVVAPQELLVDGKAPGVVSLIVWGDARRLQYDVVVDPAPSPLEQEVKLLFPDENVRVGVTEEAVVLSGRPSSPLVGQRITELAEKSSGRERVVNLMQIPGEAPLQQVMLQVRVAEVARRAIQEVGISLFTGPNGYKDFIARSSTGQFVAPEFDTQAGSGDSLGNRLTFSDFLNLFVLNTKYDVGVLIRALQSRGLFQSLAEPTLIAYNNQEASFLAGGEIPVPIAQGITGAVTVTFKEFGIRLTFRPQIAGDMIRMRVRPEVSSLDFSNGITLQGFRIPALVTRRAETEVELRDGQSFAIGGLMNNLTQDDRSRIPGLGDVPVLGALFRSRAERKERTELVVLITAKLVQPLNAGAAAPLPSLPSLPEYFFKNDERTLQEIFGKKKTPGQKQP